MEKVIRPPRMRGGCHGVATDALESKDIPFTKYGVFRVSNPQHKYGVQFLLISRITQSWGTFKKQCNIHFCMHFYELRSICSHIAVGRLRSSQAAALPWARPSAS